MWPSEEKIGKAWAETWDAVHISLHPCGNWRQVGCLKSKLVCCSPFSGVLVGSWVVCSFTILTPRAKMIAFLVFLVEITYSHSGYGWYDMFFLLKSNINPLGYCTKLRSSTSIFSITRWCPQTWLAGKSSKNSGFHMFSRENSSISTLNVHECFIAMFDLRRLFLVFWLQHNLNQHR